MITNTYQIILTFVLLCINVSYAFSQTNNNTFVQRQQEEKEKELVYIDIKKITIRTFNFNDILYNVVSDVNYYRLSHDKWINLEITDKDGNFVFACVSISNANGETFHIISESTYRYLSNFKELNSRIEKEIEKSAKKGRVEKKLKELIESPNELNAKQEKQLNDEFKNVDEQLFKKLHEELGYKKFSILIQKLRIYLDENNKLRLNNLLRKILETNKRNKTDLENKYRKSSQINTH